MIFILFLFSSNEQRAGRGGGAARLFFFFFFPVQQIFILFLFSPNEQRAGRGGGAARLFIFIFFPCSADHERDWPPCKVVFFGLATNNALNVRNNNSDFSLNNNRGMLRRSKYVLIFL